MIVLEFFKKYLFDFNVEKLLSIVTVEYKLLNVPYDFFKLTMEDLYGNLPCECNKDIYYFLDLFKQVDSAFIKHLRDKYSIKNPDGSSKLDDEYQICLDFVKRNNGRVEYGIGDDNSIVLDYLHKQVYNRHARETKKETKITDKLIINAVPTRYIMNYDVFLEDYKHVLCWDSNIDGVFSSNPLDLIGLKADLDNRNLVFQKNQIGTALAGIKQCMFDIGKYEETDTIQQQGLFIKPYLLDSSESLKDKLFVNIQGLPETLDYTKLNEALDVLEYLLNIEGFDKKKMVVVLKWYLVAPFSFVKKQLGLSFYPYLYLFGGSGVGKTTLCYCFSYIWGCTGSDYWHVGSAANTQYRLGELLRSSSLPVNINEVEEVLDKKYLVSMLKGAVENIISRAKERNGKYTKYPSFAPLVLTSNEPLPSEMQLYRRFEVIEFFNDEFLEDISFQKKIRIGNKDSCLNKLDMLGRFVIDYVEEPSLLNLNYLDLAEIILKDMYFKCKRDMPVVLFERLEVVDKQKIINSNNQNTFSSFLIERINSESKSLEMKINNSPSFQEKLEFVIDTERISWLHMVDDTEEIIFLSSVCKECKIESGLKSLALTLGDDFKYKKGKRLDVNGKSKVLSCVSVSLEDLCSFLNVKYDNTAHKWYENAEE